MVLICTRSIKDLMNVWDELATVAWHAGAGTNASAVSLVHKPLESVLRPRAGDSGSRK